MSQENIQLLAKFFDETVILLFLFTVEDGELYSWGHGGYGQLGHNDSDKNRPILVQMSKKVKQVACGSYHSVALTVDGEVREYINPFAPNALFLYP